MNEVYFVWVNMIKWLFIGILNLCVFFIGLASFLFPDSNIFFPTTFTFRFPEIAE